MVPEAAVCAERSIPARMLELDPQANAHRSIWMILLATGVVLAEAEFSSLL
jgi:hypothetical protein